VEGLLGNQYDVGRLSEQYKQLFFYWLREFHKTYILFEDNPRFTNFMQQVFMVRLNDSFSRI